ncbi:MAG: DUF4832 domain-containing protein [Planctomycetaceae bacterium]
MNNRLFGILVLLTAMICDHANRVHGQTPLKYEAAPAENPLKGLVPYAKPHADRFPHSMEFSYLPLSDLMTGPETFDWTKLEELLDDIASRRHQTVFRIWMEYPGKKEGIPVFLEQDRLKVTEWLNTNTDPFPRQMVRTPDYSDPKLRAALKSFIAALGQRYDGDSRIGYITAGLLGTWGEWHTYPREELMAGKDVQSEVMDAYEAAFKKTPVLLRYPAGENAWANAANHLRHLGYHDDSFAWATLDTGKKSDDWFYMPALKTAGPEALNKWKISPIGGEIRPELWGQIFDDIPAHPQAQNFSECVRQTHATWLMDTGMFQNQQSPVRIRHAIRQVQRMGYEFHVQSLHIQKEAASTAITTKVRNTGIAPFYHDWQLELAVLNSDNHVMKILPLDWSIIGLLPNDEPRTLVARISERDLPAGATAFAVRVVNPLPNGLPLRFANESRLQLADGWLLLQ